MEITPSMSKALVGVRVVGPSIFSVVHGVYLLQGDTTRKFKRMAPNFCLNSSCTGARLIVKMHTLRHTQNKPLQAIDATIQCHIPPSTPLLASNRNAKTQTVASTWHRAERRNTKHGNSEMGSTLWQCLHPAQTLRTLAWSDLSRYHTKSSAPPSSHHTCHSTSIWNTLHLQHQHNL